MLLPSYNCVLCAMDTEETVHHLFLQCECAKQCWQIIGVDIPSDMEFPDAMVFLKNALHSQFFMEATILICWAIWTMRNALIFNGIQPDLLVSRAVFMKEIQLVTHRVKTSFSQPFDQWILSIF